MRIPFNLYDKENLINGLNAKIEYCIPNLNFTDGIYVKIPDVEILNSEVINIRNPFIDFKISDYSFGDLENLNYVLFNLLTQYPSSTGDAVIEEEIESSVQHNGTFDNCEYLVLKEISEESFGMMTELSADFDISDNNIFVTYVDSMKPAKNVSFNITNLVSKKLKNRENSICFRIFRANKSINSSNGNTQLVYNNLTPFVLNKKLLSHYNDSKKKYFNAINGELLINDFDASKNLIESYNCDFANVYSNLLQLNSVVEFPVCELKSNNVELNLKFIIKNNKVLTNLHLYIDRNNYKIQIKDVYGKIYDYLKLNSSLVNKKYNVNLPEGINFINLNDLSYINLCDDGYRLCINNSIFYVFSYKNGNLYKLKEIYFGDVLVFSVLWENDLISNVKNHTLNYNENLLNGYYEEGNYELNFEKNNQLLKILFNETEEISNIIVARKEIYGIQDYSEIHNIEFIYEDSILTKIYNYKTKKGVWISKNNNLLEIYKYTSENLRNCYNKVSYLKENDYVKVVFPDESTKTIFLDDLEIPFLTLNSHESNNEENYTQFIQNSNYLLNNNYFYSKEMSVLKSFMKSFEENNLIKGSKFNENLSSWIEDTNVSEFIVEDDYLKQILGDKAFLVSDETDFLGQTVSGSFGQGDIYRLEFWIKSEEDSSDKNKYSEFEVSLFNQESFIVCDRIILENEKFKSFVIYFENIMSCDKIDFQIRHLSPTTKLYIKNVKLHKIYSKCFKDLNKINSIKNFDENSKIVYQKDGLDVIEYSYNNKNLITKIKNHISGEERLLEYDSLCNITKETISNNYNNITYIEYEYYSNGLLKKEIINNNLENVYNYDINGSVVDVVNCDGSSNYYQYNCLNEITLIKSLFNSDTRLTQFNYINNALDSINYNDRETYTYLYNRFLLNAGYNYATLSEDIPMEKVTYVSSTDKQVKKITNYLSPKTSMIDGVEQYSASAINYSYDNNKKVEKINIDDDYIIEYKYSKNQLVSLNYTYLSSENEKQFINDESCQYEIIKHIYNDTSTVEFDAIYFKNSNNKCLKYSNNDFKQMYLYNNLYESSVVLEIEKYNSCNINDYMIGSMPTPLFALYSQNYNLLNEFDENIHSNVLLLNNKKHYSEIDLSNINKFRAEGKVYGNKHYSITNNTVKNQLDIIMLFKPCGDNVNLFTIKSSNGYDYRFNIENALKFQKISSSSIGENKVISSIEFNKWHILRVALKYIENTCYFLINFNGNEYINEFNELSEDKTNSNVIFEKIILGNYLHEEDVPHSNLNIAYFSMNSDIDYIEDSLTSTNEFIDRIVKYLYNPCYSSNVDVITYTENYDIIDFNNNLISINGLKPKYVNYSKDFENSCIEDVFKYDCSLKKKVLSIENHLKYDNELANNIIYYEFEKSNLSNLKIKFKINYQYDFQFFNQNLLCYRTNNSILLFYINNNKIYLKYANKDIGEHTQELGFVNISEWNELSYCLKNNLLSYTLNNEHNAVNVEESYIERNGLLYVGYDGVSTFLDGYIEYIKYSSDTLVDLNNDEIVYYNKEFITNDYIANEKIKYLGKELVKSYEKLPSNFDNNLPNAEKNYDNSITYYKYNKDGLLVGISIYDSHNTNILTKYYYYDEYNRVIKEECYDNLNVFNNHIIQYEYDLNGNILKKTKHSVENDFIFEYEYNYDSNIPNLLLSVNKKMPDGSLNIEYSISYFDNFIKAVQVLNKEGIQYKVKYFNNLISSIGNNKYYYDDQGLRVKKITEQNGEYTYYYEENRLVNMTFNINGINQNYISYLYDESKQLFGLYFDGKPYFYNKDLTGNINSIVDINGKTMVKYYYDAYGQPIIITLDETNEDYELSVALSKCNVFLYKGYVYDAETQLYWVSSRYYSPELCRWISPDSIEYLDPESVNGLNLYCYCFNNPIMYIDPDGHSPKGWQWLLFGIGAVFVVAAAGMAIIGTGGVAAFGAGALVGSLAVGAGGAIVGGAIGYAVDGYDGILGGALAGFGIGAIVGFAVGGCIGLNTWNSDVSMARQFLTDNGVDSAYHDNIINSFKYRIKTKTINSDMTVYRYYSDSGRRISYWVTPKQYANPVQRLALAYGGNTAQNTATLTLQKGAQILYGKVARVGSYLGGGIQYYVPNLAWLI